MANSPFKLKSGNTTSFKSMGSSPAKIDWGYWKGKATQAAKTIKKGAGKVYDKASQIGMGLAEPSGSVTPGRGQEWPWQTFKRGYKVEQAKDETPKGQKWAGTWDEGGKAQYVPKKSTKKVVAKKFTEKDIPTRN